ncbi:MAG: ABC transporter substrate-binding protein, partial [Kiloniellales bacterium]
MFRLKTLATAAVALSALGLAAAGPAAAKVEGDTIILGSAISFTGKYSTNGIHASNGYNLGVKRVNEMGGVTVGGKQYKLEIQYYDDESTPLRTAQLFERLIKQDEIKFLLGPYSSATTKAAAKITEKYKIPMVESEGASRSLFTQGYRYLFCVISTSEQYLASSIALAAEIAVKNGRDPSDVKVAMAFENDPFSLDVRAGVVDDIGKYKIPMVESEGASRSLFTQGYKYLFCVISTSEQYLASSIALAAEIAEKNGRNASDVKVAMAFENDPFSLDVRAGVIDDIGKYKMKIVVDDKLPR